MKTQYIKPRSRAFSVGIDSILAGSPIQGTDITGGNTDVPIGGGIITGGDSSDDDGMNDARGGFWDDSEW